eukprot:gene30463-31001_t
MKKSTLTLALANALPATAACALAGAAHAQSNVQVYGLIDAGVESASNATPGGGPKTSVIPGGRNTSRWGLRGTEDLGGGLKAVFQLEGGILLDSGAQDGPLFKRQANVGLEGSCGRVVIGRCLTSVYDT